MSDIPVEGPLAKPYRIFRCDAQGEILPGGPVAECDTPDEVSKHPYRLDWHYKIQVPGGKYLNSAGVHEVEEKSISGRRSRRCNSAGMWDLNFR